MEKITKFVSESVGELKKVEFPKIDIVRATTLSVIAMVFIVSAIIGVIDFVFSRIFKLIF
ncbi:Protein translocase subunit SecE [bacterium HR19]|nr:Protein translocase subunit SecE [bacterium HR19]